MHKNTLAIGIKFIVVLTPLTQMTVGYYISNSMEEFLDEIKNKNSFFSRI